MTEIRGSAAPASPATRLIELQRQISYLQRELDGANARASIAEERLSRYTKLSGTSFGGIAMAQQWADLVMWEGILNENPQLRAIFEIGSWKGGFSWWLYGQAQARKMMFRTYDVVVPDGAMEAAVAGSDRWRFFVKSDVFADYRNLGKGFREYEPCVVFCDGGNKPRELATFSQELRHPDSLLAVHDWGTEFMPEDIHSGVRMVYTDFCEELGAITRWFRKEP